MGLLPSLLDRPTRSQRPRLTLRAEPLEDRLAPALSWSTGLLGPSGAPLQPGPVSSVSIFQENDFIWPPQPHGPQTGSGTPDSGMSAIQNMLPVGLRGILTSFDRTLRISSWEPIRAASDAISSAYFSAASAPHMRPVTKVLPVKELPRQMMVGMLTEADGAPVVDGSSDLRSGGPAETPALTDRSSSLERKSVTSTRSSPTSPLVSFKMGLANPIQVQSPAAQSKVVVEVLGNKPANRPHADTAPGTSTQNAASDAPRSHTVSEKAEESTPAALSATVRRIIDNPLSRLGQPPDTESVDNAQAGSVMADISATSASPGLVAGTHIAAGDEAVALARILPGRGPDDEGATLDAVWQVLVVLGAWQLLGGRSRWSEEENEKATELGAV